MMTPAAPVMPVWLVKMGTEVDPESFLVIFQWVSLAVRWLPDQWTTLLAAYLMGTAQAAYRGLPNDKA